jgi:hypothetical protein
MLTVGAVVKSEPPLTTLIPVITPLLIVGCPMPIVTALATDTIVERHPSAINEEMIFFIRLVEC